MPYKTLEASAAPSFLRQLFAMRPGSRERRNGVSVAYPGTNERAELTQNVRRADPVVRVAADAVVVSGRLEEADVFWLVTSRWSTPAAAGCCSPRRPRQGDYTTLVECRN